jgi:hypothetical protein
MESKWTKEAILALLNEDSKRGRIAVERALIALYERQTADEQSAETTKYQNGVGFMGAHAHTGTWLVQTVIAEQKQKGYAEGFRLRGKALEMARRIVRRYAGTQLLEIAKQKEAAAVAKQENLPGVA